MQFVEPIRAVAGIILSDEPDPRVLLARRSDELRFMGGFHVFPGGRIDDTETGTNVVGAVDDHQAAAIKAVAREIFEETGLIFAAGSLPDVEELALARRALLSGNESFDSILDRFGFQIDARRFEPAGVWVTPAIAPIRFDTQYFLCRFEGGQQEELIPGEIVAIDWLTPRDARKLWRDGMLELPPPVAYVLQNLAAYPFPEVMEHLTNTGGHRGERPAKMEFRNGVYLLPLASPTLPPATHTNAIIIGDSELYLIDPGTYDEDELQLLKSQLQLLLDLGGRIVAVLLTHSHIDHVSAAEWMRVTYGVPIYAHEETASQLEFPVDRCLVDGEIIAIRGRPDWRLRCIHTPGHDPGHLCFLEETTRTLIAGDMIANPGTIVISLDHGGDMSQFLDSLELLQSDDFDFDMILPAHGMPMNRGKEKIRKHLEHRLWREEKVKSALAQGVVTIVDLLPLVYDDVGEEAWPVAEVSLRAHLARLRHGI